MHTTQDPRRLRQTLSQAQRFFPALHEVRGRPDHSYIGPDNNRRLISKLYRHWQQAHPEAGRAYWNARCWTLLIWQPIYLSVFSVQHNALLLNIFTMHQRLSDGMVSGFYLDQRELVSASKSELIIQGGTQLRRFCHRMLEQLSEICPLRARPAWRIAADTVLNALCRLKEFTDRYSNQQIISDSQRWLSALKLEDAGSLMRIPLDNNKEKLAVNRKACCFDYLRSSGRLCPTCPKQSLQERRQRITEEFSQNASA